MRTAIACLIPIGIAVAMAAQPEKAPPMPEKPPCFGCLQIGDGAFGQLSPEYALDLDQGEPRREDGFGARQCPRNGLALGSPQEPAEDGARFGVENHRSSRAASSAASMTFADREKLGLRYRCGAGGMAGVITPCST